MWIILIAYIDTLQAFYSRFKRVLVQGYINYPKAILSRIWGKYHWINTVIRGTKWNENFIYKKESLCRFLTSKGIKFKSVYLILGLLPLLPDSNSQSFQLGIFISSNNIIVGSVMLYSSITPVRCHYIIVIVIVSHVSIISSKIF